MDNQIGLLVTPDNRVQCRHSQVYGQQAVRGIRPCECLLLVFLAENSSCKLLKKKRIKNSDMQR